MKQTNRFFRFPMRTANGAPTAHRIERIESPAASGLFRLRHENAEPSKAAQVECRPSNGPSSPTAARITFRV